MDGFSCGVEEGEADVPFADEGGGVALVAEHLGEGEAALFDHVGAAGSGEDGAVSGAEGHAAGEDAVAGGGADG